MRINEYDITIIAQALGIKVKNSRFSHNCPGKGVDDSETYAKLLPNNAFYCHRCAGNGVGKAYGSNTDLIQDTLGITTSAEFNEWAKANLPDYEAITTEISSESMISELSRKVMERAHLELMQNDQAVEWIEQKYGISKKTVEAFGLGLITQDVIDAQELLPSQTFNLHLFKNYVCIPLSYEGVVHGLICRYCEPMGAKNDVKYRRLIDTTETPEVVFNYDHACNYFKKNQDAITPLIVCESEFDVMALYQLGQPYAISVSSATSHSNFQCKQIAQLAQWATCAITVFDNDYGSGVNTGREGAATLIEKMLKLGVDFKQLVLPELGPEQHKTDVAELLVRGMGDILLASLVKCTSEQATWLHDYIERSRPNLQKASVQKKLVEYIVRFNDSMQENYVRQLARVPKEMANQPNLNQIRIDPKVMKKLLKAKASQLSKQKEGVVKLEFSDADEEATARFYAHDYWFDKKYQQFYATKMVFADVNRPILNEDGEASNKIERQPILIQVKSTVSGTVFIDRVERIEEEKLTEEEVRRIPDDIDLYNNVKTWAQNGGEYSFRNFINSKGALKVNSAEIYDEIYAILNKYFYFKYEAYAHVLTAYIMLSYVYMLFSAVPYLHFNGTKGTGKTTMAVFMSELCYRPISTVNSSDTHLFRNVHSGRGMFLYDEAENLSSYNGAKSERAQNIVTLCNSSYTKKGGLVPRQKEGNRDKTEWFYAYSPKVFMSISSLSEALKSRCLQIQTVKIPKSKAHLYTNVQDDMILLDSEIQELKNKLCVWSLTEFAPLRDSYIETVKDLRDDKGIANRELQLWSPLIAIMNLCGKADAVAECIAYANASSEREEQVSITSPRTEFFVCLHNWLMDFQETPTDEFHHSQETKRFLAPRGDFERGLVSRLAEKSNGYHPYLSNKDGADFHMVGILVASEVLVKKPISYKELKQWGRVDVKRNNLVYEIDLNKLEKELEAYYEQMNAEGDKAQ